MDERQKLILFTIIKEHVKTGQPVGSSVLAEKYNLGVSPATIRNVMATLEAEGYIAQPHTSAGRVPTAKAYELFLEKIPSRKLVTKEMSALAELITEKNESNFKLVAKAVAKLSGNAVFWAFHRHNLYYTGLTNLLEQPEFAQSNVVYEMGSIIDRLDEIVDKVFDDLPKETQVLLGANNPFGHFFGTVMQKYQSGDNIGLVGILGPMRMDYEKNVLLLSFLVEKLNAKD